MNTAPASVVDQTGNPRFGTYTGPIKSSALAKVKGKKKFCRHKQWQYQVIATPELIALYAIVDLNYGSAAFVTAYHFEEGLLIDKSFTGVPLLTNVTISDSPAENLFARFDGCGKLNVRGSKEGYSFHASHKDFFLNADAKGDFSRAISVIAPVEEGLVNVTQKLILDQVNGAVTLKGKTYDLSRGLVGVDYTRGYLARRNKWRWAMGMGRLEDGTPFGFNFAQGLNESDVTSENAFWVGDKVYPLGKASFVWNRENLQDSWYITTDDRKISIEFKPKYVHREEKNLGVVKSSFAQPLGLFSGTVVLDDRSFSFKDAGGVTEFQDSTW